MQSTENVIPTSNAAPPRSSAPTTVLPSWTRPQSLSFPTSQQQLRKDVAT